MKLIQLTVLLVFILVGLLHRQESKAPTATPVHTNEASTAVNPEILKNAERLAETLRACQQTAQKNKETK